MPNKQLIGIHHVSAITKNARDNYNFYTKMLGLRLVKKTVNQDDTSMYHLFYADERGNPGTDFTFFEIPVVGRTYEGTNCISLTTLRVKNDKALEYWKNRFNKYGVQHEIISEVCGRSTLAFKDHENQRLMLVSDEKNVGVPGGKAWGKSTIPDDYGIIGLGPVELTVSRLERTVNTLVEVLGFRKKHTYQSSKTIHVYETGEGGSGAEVHVIEEKALPREKAGRGSVHHVAFRVKDNIELKKWENKLTSLNIGHSGIVERYYFQSLYFREPNGILFELATDGPGFEVDEEFEELGEKLALPPFFEDKRAEIEAKLQPLETSK
ncbi:ring-cleaving dioxygenase [Evansella cellulosilytica]|uniref:Glyoxalase/bleomycin resistance protein/dioxygenase n=1 Tax=Evansella cellulosilytica (strain ATCC 21833 / DSM 2522 / FERM P-1141 / JCM 9156 / N-4) TaxID=649639 RepID=E6U0D7_EVAC2|nr:ring-cleaving dioxygenase [Evansella cellulosilytica]ADU30253.1 Glyoxalase/bleomycin resistance protein/dioxygenase [Evansella cellulosilytica DSM 2522]